MTLLTELQVRDSDVGGAAEFTCAYGAGCCANQPGGEIQALLLIKNGISVQVRNGLCIGIAQFDIVFASIADCQAYVANSASAVSLHQREIIRGACSRCGSTTCSEYHIHIFLGSPGTTLKIDMKSTGIIDGRFTITQRAITDTWAHIDCLIFRIQCDGAGGVNNITKESDLCCVATRGLSAETIPITKDAVTASLQKWDDFIVLSLINVFYGSILYAYTKGYAA